MRGGGFILEGDLFHLEKTMVSALHKELEHKVAKLKNKKVRGQAAEDQNQIWTSSWYKPPQTSPHKILQSWLINAVYHYFSGEEYLGEGRGA